ncbi:uncharacterized protein LOC143872610 [Tasmannia lanceolata]|uniref:uncharacterized protein LOC143872610 n=1 Tax=Tasmannia lanceolata TaxID=3420 RepID=UPI0040639E33
MKSLSGLGIGLTLVFGCLLFALIAELYYLLWWKKRITNRDIEEDYGSSTRELLYLFCWKKPSLSSRALDPQRITDTHGHEPSDQIHFHSNHEMDFYLKPLGEDGGVEAEIMRVHNLSGPPRFLFTIMEETKEDLESEDGKSRGDKSRKGSRTRSLSDILLGVETLDNTPFLTPLSSPPFFTPPLTPMDYYHQGFNPLFESSTDAEMNRNKSSPPPKFKFLKDAEEKLYRRTVLEKAMKVDKNVGFVQELVKAPPVSNEEDGSFITITIGKSKEKEQQYHSSSSQVLPLSSSPSDIRPSNKKPTFH